MLNCNLGEYKNLGRIVMQRLFKNSYSFQSQEEKDSQLIDAAKIGDTDKVNALLVKGANVDAKTYLGQTALMFAASNGHKDIAVMLIGKGADVDTKTYLGQTAALMFAAGNGHKDIADIIISKYWEHKKFTPTCTPTQMILGKFRRF